MLWSRTAAWRPFAQMGSRIERLPSQGYGWALLSASKSASPRIDSRTIAMPAPVRLTQ